MKTTITPHSAVEAEAWDHLADTSPEAWLWHRRGFQLALTTWPGRSDVSFAVAGSGGELLAVVPLHVVRRRIGPGTTLARLDSHGGPACREDLSARQLRHVRRAVVEQLLSTAAKVDAIDIRIKQPAVAPCRWPDGEDISPLLTLGFNLRAVGTWILDLRHGDRTRAWETIQSGTRSYIEEHGDRLNVREAGGPAGLDAYYELHVATFRRTGARPHPRDYFAMVWDGLVEPGLATPLLAYDDEVPVAGAIIAHQRGRAQYWMGASHRRGRELRANDVLQWSVIQRLIDAGIDVYELGPAHFSTDHHKRAGISYFKSKFASGLVREPRAFWDTASRWQGAVRSLYAMAVGDVDTGTRPWTARRRDARFTTPW